MTTDQSSADRLEQEVKDLREERMSFLMTIAAIINQMGGEFHLVDKHVLALRPDSFQVESRKDVDNRCTVMRVVMKE
jgi:hypothetical protein